MYKRQQYSREECQRLQKAFGYSYEEVKTSILNMAMNGSEGIGAMGIDAPLAVLSEQHQSLFVYFKQLFAQVTNPPIDAIREKIVTSTTVYVGEEGNLLEQKEENCHVLKINAVSYTHLDVYKRQTESISKADRKWILFEYNGDYEFSGNFQADS